VFPADQLTVTVDDSVTDLSGFHLDGEWDNPCALADTGTSVFPSGDDIEGGDFEFYVTTMPGDANRDNIVSGSDLSIVLNNFNSGPGRTFAQGDASGDGYVDSSDLNLVLVSFNADYTSCPIAPQVTEVSISGSTSTHAAYNFSTADGSGDQLRTVPVGGANVIAIKFSEDVAIAQSNLRFIALNKVVSEPTISAFVEPSSTNGFTATWTFSSAFPAAQYLISLSDVVVDLGGVALDGDWSNPESLTSQNTSVFPSGDGIAGKAFEFILTILPGDANRDLQVNSNDLNVVLANFNTTGSSWTQGDFTGEGAVNGSDLALVLNFFNGDWRTLRVIGDVNGADFDVDDLDEDDFLSLHAAQDADADLDGNGLWNQADVDAFYEQFNFGIELELVA
jgi:hypothetical protein